MNNKKLNILDKIDQVIQETADNIHDYIDDTHAFTRTRKLDAFKMIKTTINMQGNSLDKELYDAFSDAEELVSSSAYVQQKSKLSPDCFEHVFHTFNHEQNNLQLLNDKYRLLAIDGSDFNQPWNPDSQNIVSSSKSNDYKKYCQIHLNASYDLLNNTYQDAVLQPKNKIDERTAAIKMLKRKQTGPTIITMDRGYFSFNLIENCNRIKNCFYVVRSKVGKGAIKEIKSLPDQECDISLRCKVTCSGHYYMTHKNIETIHRVSHYKRQYIKQRSKNTIDANWDFEDICTVKFRVCKFRINNEESGKEEWEVLVTNLSPEEFSLHEMKELYHLRWGIESSFRELKYDIGSVQFHSKQDKFIEMELWAHITMFNIVSRINAQVCIPQTKSKYDYLINFKMSCVVVHKRYGLFSEVNYERILIEIGYYVVPVRPGRKDQRNLKPKGPVYFLYRVA